MSIIKSQQFNGVGVTDWIPAPALSKICQATLTGGASGSVTVEATNDKVGIIAQGAAINLAAPGATGFVDVTGNWNYIRFNVTANTGGGVITVTASGAMYGAGAGSVT
jgi:hypothetical protein